MSGGGYGDVRARIDQDKLNAYLSTNVPAVSVPVTVKQFKVRRAYTAPAFMNSHSVLSLARSVPSYYVLWIDINDYAAQSNPTYFLTDAKCVSFHSLRDR
jgi:hypothetical protein